MIRYKKTEMCSVALGGVKIVKLNNYSLSVQRKVLGWIYRNEDMVWRSRGTAYDVTTCRETNRV